MEICDFRWAPVVSVPNAEVVNTSVSQLCQMASSYVGHLGTKMAFQRSACLNT
jgi:hypothetical protein